MLQVKMVNGRNFVNIWLLLQGRQGLPQGRLSLSLATSLDTLINQYALAWAIQVETDPHPK